MAPKQQDRSCRVDRRSSGDRGCITSSMNYFNTNQPIFINFSDPSQMKDERVREKVKSFTSAYNSQRHKKQRWSQEDSLSRDDRKPLDFLIKLPPTAGSITLEFSHESQKTFESVKSKQAKCPRKSPKLEDEQPPMRLDLRLDLSSFKIRYLESYPEEQRPHLSHVVEYYFRVCGPKVIWRAEVLDAGPSAFQRDYFQWSIEHPAHLEALLAVSQYVSDKMKHKAQIYSTSVIRHRGKCLKLLRDTLTEVEHLNNDDIMMTVIVLLVLDVAIRDWTALETNIAVCRTITEARGGLEHLGFRGFCASALQWAETRFTNHLSIHNPSHHRFKHIMSASEDWKAELDSLETVSKLPPGFQKLAQHNSLHPIVVMHLGVLAEWSIQCQAQLDEADGTKAWSLHEWYAREMQLVKSCAEVLSSRVLTALERLLLIGCMAFTLASGWINDRQVTSWRIPRGIAEHLDPPRGKDYDHLRLDTLYKSAVSVEGAKDCLLWVALAIAGTEDGPLEQNNQTLLLDIILSSRKSNPHTCTSRRYDEDAQRSWESISSIINTFFWREDLDRKWETCWDAARRRATPGIHIDYF